MRTRRDKTPTREDIESWASSVDGFKKSVVKMEIDGRGNEQACLDMRATIYRYETAIAAYMPIVELYESTNALAKRIWALGVAVEEMASAPEADREVAVNALTGRIGALTVERQTKLKQAGALLKEARKA